MDVSWLHDIAPSKIKSNLNCCCQLMCDDWGILNAKLKFCQCTSAALLCCKNTQLFNYMTYNNTWMMNLNSPIIPRCYKTSFSTEWLFLCIWDFVRSRDQTGSGGRGIDGELADIIDEWRSSHDDVIKWKHFPRYWPFVRGIHRSPVNSPHKGQWRGALMLSLICTRINGWVNNREAGDLRRHRAHYDVTVMVVICQSVCGWCWPGCPPGMCIRNRR